MSDATETTYNENAPQDLADADLANVAGGGRPGGPICPKCGSSNVAFDARRFLVLSCNDCGWKR
ncbi:MAG: hypothetical protein U0J70_01645 [Atopobiaceae bacterium]|jgi:hypothetical protein|nr:hypothetical protein [Atopobiaceae bacterium]